MHIKWISKWISYGVVVLGFMSSLAKASFFEDHARGWHWYEAQKKAVKRKKPLEKRSTPHMPQNPSQILKDYQREMKRRLDQALVMPTIQNVKAYQEIQQDMMERNHRFANVWQRVVLTTPELDHTLRFPVNQMGRHVYAEQQQLAQDQKIRELSKKFGLFFFFKGNCPYCHAFAPIVKRFAQHYGWSVIAISLDGSTIEEFPHATKDNGIASNLKIQSVPSLIAADPSTNSVIPLSYGLASEAEIKQKMMLLYPENGNHQ